MKKRTLAIPLFLAVLSACGQSTPVENKQTTAVPTENTVENKQTTAVPTENTVEKELAAATFGNTISTRFPSPSGFDRLPVARGSFAEYLRNLTLLAPDAKVHLYNGAEKWRQDVHVAVVNMDMGDKDLQQCADAVMRLRAEYLLSQKKYGDIHFNFTNGFPAEYDRWRQGERIKVTDNKCVWQKTAAPSDDYAVFRKYMDLVFMYAGTLSLSKELKPVAVKDLQIGDVFIRGGSPGHAVIVVDVAEHPKTHKKVFLLAQSYMPAQEIHVLKNPMDEALSPWYSEDFGDVMETPEWEFARGELMRF